MNVCLPEAGQWQGLNGESQQMMDQYKNASDASTESRVKEMTCHSPDNKFP